MGFVSETQNKASEPLLNVGWVEGGSKDGSWGWLPTLSMLGAIGSLLVAMGYSASRLDLPWGETLFWSGIAALFVPIAGRLSSATAARRERIGLVVLLGLALYLVKLLNSPVSFTFHDELTHWRTADDILQHGRLFQPNPIIPPSALYPGLEIVTTSMVSMSGLPVFVAGAIVLGIARLLLVLALFLLYEGISGSAQVGGIATLLYMANPSFVFFDGQFSYESFALPLAVFVLFAAARRWTTVRGGSVGMSLAVLLGIVALVITHHLTAYSLVLILALWTMVSSIRRTGERVQGPGTMALFTLVLCLAWLVYLAEFTLYYLRPYPAGAMKELVEIIIGEASGRQLFRSFSGQMTPLWEQLVGYASVALILVVLPIGLYQIGRRQSHANAFALALAVGAVAYPPSLPLRLTYSGAEASSRMSGHLFVAVAFVVAKGIVRYLRSHRTHWTRNVAFACYATVVFVGGMVVGWPKWARMPGPYLTSADMRSVEPQGIAAARWVRASLGSHNRLSADRVNSLLMASYGGQRVVTVILDGVLVAPVFFSSEVGPDEWAILKRGQVHYVVVDHRLSNGLPMAEVYFERGERGTYRHRIPLDPEVLSKFDEVTNMNRIFDSGDIVIYDVGVPSGAK